MLAPPTNFETMQSFKKIISILILILSYQKLLFGQEFKIDLGKDEFVVGEAILATFTLVNNSPQKVYADAFQPFNGEGINWFIIREDGYEKDTITYAGIEIPSGGFYYPSEEVNPGESLVVVEGILEFANGYSYEDQSVRWSSVNSVKGRPVGERLSGFTLLKEGFYTLKASFSTKKFNIRLV